ncbi:prepronociceptin isoform 2-T2 [Menidia menidia]
MYIIKRGLWKRRERESEEEVEVKGWVPIRATASNLHVARETTLRRREGNLLCQICTDPIKAPSHTTNTGGGTMKTLVALLLLCLCDPGRSDCQGDCLSCSKTLPKLLNFKTAVCLIECEGKGSLSFSWDLCRSALSSPGSSVDGTPRKRSQEEAESLFPEEEEQMNEDLLLPIALQRFDHVARALDMNDRGLDSKSAAYDSQNALSLENEYEEEAEGLGEDAGMAKTGLGEAGLSISKRFGGFVKGRHGYRRLMSPGRSYQKRYGGFIGIRKSARKWNNQKRFSEFLKQYLGMSSRATEFNSMSDLTQQNEV